MLKLLDFNQLFQLGFDANRTTIGEVLSQEGSIVAYFSEKLNYSKNIFLL